MLKTLGEIIDAAKSGQVQDVDDLRYAVCALDALMTFDRQAIWKLVEAESAGKKPFLVYSATWQRDEQFNRVKRALGKAPREWLGPTHDPDSPEVQKRRQVSNALMQKLMDDAK